MRKLKLFLASIVVASFLCSMGFVSFIEGFLSQLAETAGNNLPWWFEFVGIVPFIIIHGLLLSSILSAND
jgi:hypothetical protein